MKLKEIQMDLPFIYSDDISNEESVKLYQTTWKDKRREFQLFSRCMTSMIERLMPSINTKNYWKIIIECVEGTPKAEGIYMPEILFVQVLFDIDCFYKFNNYEKKKPVRLKNKSVQIKVLHEVDKVSIYMIFKDEDKIVEEVLLVEDIPDEWVYSKYLGKLEWVSENKAQLTTKSGDVYFGEIF